MVHRVCELRQDKHKKLICVFFSSTVFSSYIHCFTYYCNFIFIIIIIMVKSNLINEQREFPKYKLLQLRQIKVIKPSM